MKLLMFSTYRPFRAVRVFAAQLNTASESTNHMYCVNSVRWLNLTVASSINLSVVIIHATPHSKTWADSFFITKYPQKLSDGTDLRIGTVTVPIFCVWNGQGRWQGKKLGVCLVEKGWRTFGEGKKLVSCSKRRSGLKHGPLALNEARPWLKRGPAAHTVLRNRNAMSHATSKRHRPVLL